MINIGQYWNPKQSLLKELLGLGELEKAKIQLDELHSIVHSAEIYHVEGPTIMDNIWNRLNEKAFRLMSTVKDVTIAWNIWHITRIEDITANILIANTNQVLNNKWLERMNVDVKDTGNSMTDEEIISFSNRINPNELKKYRDAVGSRTKQIISDIKKEDLKRKFGKEQLDKIKDQGGILDHPDSVWLLDFWGRKTVAGILLMPITRHQIVHLNDCLKLKGKCERLR